jgi:5-methylthioribose kinase
VILLDASDLTALSRYLHKSEWLKAGEIVTDAQRAGEGNMNYVIRVRTGARSFILKQARPWVEKYPQIAAPRERAKIEACFYREVRSDSATAAHVPKLLAFDAQEQVLMIEDLGPARDMNWLYQSSEDLLTGADLDALIHFLLALHTGFQHPSLSLPFRNREIRELNHEHVFALPLRSDNGLNLDTITPGLAVLARQIRNNHDYLARVAALGRIYLDATGPCLLHGDYFPGSWLKTDEKVYVIDHEFSFYGPPEWDVGVMVAHFHLAGQRPEKIARILDLYASAAPLDHELMAAFAGVEIMRRLIGVAQLPLACGVDRKEELLDLSVELVLGKRAA